MLPNAIPAALVVPLQMWRLERRLRWSNHRPSFKHESHGIGNLLGLARILKACSLKCVRIWPMAGHAIMQRRSAGYEPFGLRIVGAMDQSHELAGDVAMKPRRPESVLHYQPSRWEDDKVSIVDARCIAD